MRSVECACIQYLAVVRHVIWAICLLRYEFIQILTAAIVTGIKGHLAIVTDRTYRAFASEPAHGGALGRTTVWSERVEFNYPAETIGLIDMALVGLAVVRRGVKPGLYCFPCIIAAAASQTDAIAFMLLAFGVILLIPIDEVVVEVLFTRQVGSPRGDTHGAVVKRAQYFRAGGVALGFHARIGSQGAANSNWGEPRNSAIERGVFNALPIPLRVFAYFNNTQTMRCHLLVNLIGGASTAAIWLIGEIHSGGMQCWVYVFMIDHQQAALVGLLREGEEVHAVVIVTRLQHLILPGVRTILAPGCSSLQHGITPAEKRLCAITGGHDHIIERR